MKIVICGKGGSGKSTLTSLMAHEYARAGNRVLVIDTDESNRGLYRLLGVPAPDDLMDYFGGKSGLREKMGRGKHGEKSELIEEKWTIGTIPEEFIARKDGISLVSIGKIHHSGEGCACPMGVLAKQFIQNLQLEQGDVVITDTEAGIEHFGRGIDAEADCVMMMVDPSFESIGLAEKIAEMMEGMDIPLYYVLNRVNPEIRSSIRGQMSHPEKIVAEIPEDANILAKGLSGTPITGKYQVIQDLIARISKNG